MMNIPLSSYLKIGDRVVFTPTTKRQKAEIAQAEGEEGTVVGFTRHRRVYTYGEGWFQTPSGIYSYNGSPYVLWDNKKVDIVDPRALCFVDSSLYQERHSDCAYQNAFDVEVFESDLPALPYLEGDTVQLKPNAEDESLIATISKVLYGEQISREGSVVFNPRYRLQGESASHVVLEKEIAGVIKRGPYWTYFREGVQPSFASSEAKDKFYFTIGQPTP